MSATSFRHSVNSTVNTVLALGGDDELSWEDLCAIERRRRAILSRTELPFFRILLFWDGTVLNALAHDALMWICMLTYIGTRTGARVGGLPEFFADLGGVEIASIGGFLIFFLVFFVVSCNKRFDSLYGLSMSCEGRIFDVAAVAKAIMPRDNAFRLVRYMNAVHIAGYVGLSSTYTFTNYFEQINKRNRILTDEECDRVRKINMSMGGSVYRELVTWCLADINTAYKEDLIDNRQRGLLFGLVLRLRGHLGALYDYDDQPVSFFYLHFICLLTVMYLPLFSISAALAAGSGDNTHWISDLLSGLIVFLTCVFVIGLRLLGQKMSDPYGSDVEDLSVMHYVNFTWRMSRRMLESELPGPIDRSKEAQLVADSQGIVGGEAWADPFDAEESEESDSENLKEQESQSTFYNRFLGSRNS